MYTAVLQRMDETSPLWGGDAPIGIPADPEPYDPPVGKDRPEKVKEEEEVGYGPGDEAVKLGRATARGGWGWGWEGS